MTCPHCNTQALSAGQRYCHACGAFLGAPPRYEGNAVGDGSARPLVLPRAAAVWAGGHTGRVLLVGGGVALAAVVLLAVVVTIITAVVAAVATLLPIIVVIAALSMAARPHRRRRRYRYRSRGPVVWL